MHSLKTHAKMNTGKKDQGKKYNRNKTQQFKKY